MSHATPLTPSEIQTALATLPGWALAEDGRALCREFRFADFAAAWGFMSACAVAAEALNHHPDWSNVWNRVSVRLNTHDAGGQVTARDVALAQRMQGLAGG
ncbi:4a-hydroxytetrahydrobiopterin dehydratase [Ideonella livida]|uniref:Putative pterin-4-alpha-carbinolamine dehydratase n=1 Tax=Ideonella livida TaxID=2707176 RepID=A0A7C9PJZ8_9BURK|nr:4a-hydroxytetrahydrobiopterin dehydratase [Ideonella livida]NDY92932.1 4a-hydroxytetrahydrobiopterin dehydratase [Ideonella livida]